MSDKLFLKFEKPSKDEKSFGVTLGDSKKWMQFFFISSDKKLYCTTWKYYGMKTKCFEIDDWIGYYTPCIFDFEIKLDEKDV